MPTPANWNMVPVRGQFIGTDGNPVTGRVIFTPKATRLIDTNALTTLIGRSLPVTLDATGSFEVMLPATDDPDILPLSFTYTVKEDFVGGGTYSIDVPVAAATAGVNLALAVEASATAGASATSVTIGQLGASVVSAQAAQAAAEAARDGLLAQKGVALGIAPLDSAAAVPDANLPSRLTATNLSAAYAPGGTAGNIDKPTAQGIALVHALIFGG